jgi:glycosyltransferase involved in cell wall biosynthesis
VFLLNSTGMGGAELVSVQLACELQRRGAEVLVVCPPGTRRLIELVQHQGVPYQTRRMGVSVGRWRGWLGTALFLLPGSHRGFGQLVADLAAERPSVFVAPFLREQLLLARLRARWGIQVVWALHAPLHYLPHRLVLRRLQRRRAATANAIVAVSQRQAAECIRAGMPASRVRVIRNGIPQTSFVERPSQQGSVGDTTFRIGFISRLTKGKGAQYLCRALPRVLLHYPRVSVEIAGAGAYESRLRRLVGALHLTEHVRFLGFVSNVPALLQTLDLVVLPTVDRGEVAPIVLLEAAAAAVPVIASDVAGIREQVVSGVTGVLVLPGNSDQLADAICMALSDPGHLRWMGEQGQEYVRAHYALARAGAEFIRLLRELDEARATTAGKATGTPLTGRWPSPRRNP